MYGLSFGFPPRSGEIRPSRLKPDRKICEFPPSSPKELFASLLEFVASDFCTVPITASLLFNRYSTQNEHFKAFPEHLKEESLYECLDQLAEKGAVDCQSMFTFSKMDTVVTAKDSDVLLMLNREHLNDRPSRLPEKVSRELVPQKLDQRILYKQRVKEEMKGNTLMREYMIRQAEEERHNKYLASLAQEKMDYGFDKLSPDLCQHETRLNCFAKTGQRYCRHRHYYRKVTPQCQPSEDAGIRQKDHDRCQKVQPVLEDDGVVPLLKKIYIALEVKLSQRDHPKPMQWINCDLRHLDYTVLGKFDAIMLDPPWDIHMSLPYPTLKDKEMRSLKVKDLQDDGVCFLWVTGRALELGRECLAEWGYKQVEELVWVKVTHNRIVRTGRTGHWLNHSKEHCLIGVKGNTSKLNRNIDTDVLLAPVRETSRKPDEIYSLIERMAPGGRKVELFARPHNRRPGWLSLGNQLPGIYLAEQDVLERMRAKYPELNLTDETMNQMTMIEQDKDFHQMVYYNHHQRLRS